ncbi:hypothetical protein [Flavobacterium jumunjinense]|uniref:PRMT5 arginine-N-methyltransferase domain-containing protein n=1 Tax=Flavobacterium jumunjinense TaxID=998845 RepID=A0ABV5GT64_9FLAO|nr:hypothetical protein [Flavobacterium jumunjinense]
MSHKAILQNIGSIFKKEENDFLELTQTINNYKEITYSLSDINLENEANRADIHFNNGKALGTAWAAMCIDDIIRTKIFVKSVFNAIETLKEKKSRPIHILYAGTGPFATLLLPIFATYSPKEVKATLLEINQESFDSVKQVISKLGFEGHIVSYENEDATTFTIDKAIPVDIILSETLQCGLVKEQQVPITLNLLNQVPKNTILIPEMLALDVCLLNLKAYENRTETTPETDYCIVLDRLIEINNTSNIEFQLDNTTTETKILSEKEITVLPKEATQFETLVLITRMTIFGDNKIKINESGLTVPIIIQVFNNQTTEKKFKISYKIDSEPGYVIHW